jgi:hemerythrin-like domain-containing protein
MMEMKSFSDLLRLHQVFDELFFEHQRALIRGDLDTALRILVAYEIELLDHIWDEEEVLIPIYAARAEAPVGGSTEIFLNEHRKMRGYVALFKAEFTNLSTADDRERAVIFLLDSQTTFKRLLVHHDTRERKFLYPLLDQITTEQERLTLFQRLKLPAQEGVVLKQRSQSGPQHFETKGTQQLAGRQPPKISCAGERSGK